MNRAVVAAIVLAVAPAFADDAPYPAPPQPPPQPQPYPPPQPYAPPAPYGYAPPAPYATPAPNIDGPKSTGTAVLCSLGGLFAPGLIVSAAFGDGAGNNQNGDLVISVLLASALVGPSAGHIYAGNFFTIGLGVRAAGLTSIIVGAHSGGDDGLGFVVLGSLAALGGAIADFASLGSSVREYNLEFHRRQVMPTVAPIVDASGAMRPMAGLAGSF